MVDKYINFRANEIASGLIGDQKDSLEAAKLLRKTADVGRQAMGSLPPKDDEQNEARGDVASAEFKLRQENKKNEDHGGVSAGTKKPARDTR